MTIATTPTPPLSSPRDVQVAEIAPQTWIWRSRTWDRLKFEIEYARQKGTTANAYTIRGDRFALLDPPGESFTEMFLQALAARLALDALDDIVLHHVNPNRAATLKALVDRVPQVRIVCSKPAANALRSAFPHWEERLYEVRDGDRLDLGQGHILQFISVKTPRWPDGLCSFDPATEVLFADKFYGAHLCGQALTDERWKELDSDRRYYFDCLHASQVRQVTAALDKLDAVPATCIAPGHGPLVKYSLSRLRHDYHQWCREQSQQVFQVAVLYASAYGNTAILAGAIAQALVELGISVTSLNCEYADSEEISRAIAACDGFIIGSPTLGGHAPTQIQTVLGIVISTAAKTQLAGVFGSYGWSGEAIDLIAERLRNANLPMGFEPIRVRFTPTAEALETCQTAAAQFAQTLRRQQRQRTIQQGVTDTQTNRTEQAIGRIIGSLCILTTCEANDTPAGNSEILHRGMLTSAVSQASFQPPGIMVAIAPEDLSFIPHPGDSFVLNVLKEGRNLRRHFLSGSLQSDRHPDAFASLTSQAAENGCLIFKAALAYLECTVETATECGDRWLIYALVDRGEVLAEGITAIQHRTLPLATLSRAGSRA